MASKQLSRLSFHWRVTLLVSALVLLGIELVVHGIIAKRYYDLNVETLRLTAVAAVKKGAQYLPTDPNDAIREADAYAEGHGIAHGEIVFTELSSNNSVLTIRLVRKIPLRFVVLVWGGLPSRDIEVTASAGNKSHNAPNAQSIMLSSNRSASRRGSNVHHIAFR